MTAFLFSSPDGTKYRVNGPDGSTQEQAWGVLQQQLTTQKQAPSVASGLVRSASEGVLGLGGLLNKADAATDAAIAPVFNRFFPDKDQLKGDFSDRYSQALKTQEGADEAFAQEHPYLDTAARVAGGIASTGVAAGTATGAKLLGLTQKTLPRMIAAGAASGAAIGGADSAIRGGDASEGAIYGGLAGAAGPVVGRVAGAALNKLGRTAQAIATPLLRSLVHGMLLRSSCQSFDFVSPRPASRRLRQRGLLLLGRRLAGDGQQQMPLSVHPRLRFLRPRRLGDGGLRRDGSRLAPKGAEPTEAGNEWAEIPPPRYSPAASSFSPRATIRSASSGSGRCSFRASSVGPTSHVSISSGRVRMTGMALG
jgi:hypothetical protein